ncbi:MAG: nucleoside triphosphate pyrophosphohydrolase [Leptolyngbyaceae cyanobacterium bins.59]|nr:nucleoside triphosphate pyrophosphohydrolase [Leptolyngbyaceae cyanobacterium bins.59]
MADPANSALNPSLPSDLAALQKLIAVVAQLRSPDGGCPWDLAQTPQTLTPYVIEEAYEVVDAIQSGDQKAIAEELGDLLLQVVLQAQIASETQQFTLTQVAEGITEKLIRRHPHVFSGLAVEGVEEVKENWEQIKAAEKGQEAGDDRLSPKLDRYARTLPPLTGAFKISQKAAAVGFEWDDIQGVWEKFQEELGELQEALAGEDKAHQQSELGDLLFTLVNIARWYDLDPAAALHDTNKRFIKRFSLVESVADRPLKDYNLEELEALWQQAKATIRQAQGEE